MGELKILKEKNKADAIPFFINESLNIKGFKHVSIKFKRCDE